MPDAGVVEACDQLPCVDQDLTGSSSHSGANVVRGSLAQVMFTGLVCAGPALIGRAGPARPITQDVEHPTPGIDDT